MKKANNNITELVFILDRLGSMGGLESDTIGGAIHNIGNIHKYARSEDVPEHIVFVIMTDGYENAIHFGINEDRAVNYHADSQGTSVVYDTVADTVCCMRASLPIDADWSNSINEDYNNRK